MAQVDWPGASFWREISAANPDALVLLSTRDPEAWYRSASNTIFQVVRNPPPGREQWFATTMHKMWAERFSDDLENPTAMMDAFERHNAQVRAGVPAGRLLEWTSSDGWEPICERLGVAVPIEAFPAVNSTKETRAVLGMPPLPQSWGARRSARGQLGRALRLHLRPLRLVRLLSHAQIPADPVRADSDWGREMNEPLCSRSCSLRLPG